MKSFYLVIISFFILTAAQAQTNYEKFKTLLAAKDTAGTRALLKTWEKTGKNDPEFYTSYFNFYLSKSLSEVIVLGDNPGKKSFQVRDSANKAVGYIYPEAHYNPVYLQRAFQVIDKGIALFPNRLDMRFGKTHLLGEVKDFDLFSKEIVKTIAQSDKNKNRWEWTKSEPVKEPKTFMLDNIQTYINLLYNEGDQQAANIRAIAQETLLYYPDHTVSLSNLAISYIFELNYKKALEALLKAETQAPQDAIVLGNIAYVYTQLQQNQKAIEYYEKVIVFGDNAAKDFSREQVNKLKH